MHTVVRFRGRQEPNDRLHITNGALYGPEALELWPDLTDDPWTIDDSGSREPEGLKRANRLSRGSKKLSYDVYGVADRAIFHFPPQTLQ